MKKIADFLGRSLTDKQVSYIVHKTRFDVMTNDPAVNFKMHPFLKVIEPEEARTRSGMYTLTIIIIIIIIITIICSNYKPKQSYDVQSHGDTVAQRPQQPLADV